MMFIRIKNKPIKSHSCEASEFRFGQRIIIWETVYNETIMKIFNGTKHH